jgi:hypothetical protein
MRFASGVARSSCAALSGIFSACSSYSFEKLRNTPTTSNSTVFKAPSIVLASKVTDSPGLTCNDRARPSPTTMPY